ncbi:MAG TPA: diguanylate cyclase [Alphaproteobacteria bacterium]|nr:diguanylate cyclase [Alphaproteobacteria bacterium]
MNRRASPANLASVLDDHVHWMGRWQCALMFPDKVDATNPYGPDTLLRWLAEPEQAQILSQPIIRRLQQLHDELHDMAYELGKVAPRSRPPFELYEDMLRNFDNFVAQLRRTERLLVSAARVGGLATLQSGKSMEIILKEITDLMQRAESKGQVASLAVSAVDGFERLKDQLGVSTADYIATEVTGRIGHNLRPFDDVFRMDEAYAIWFLQQAEVGDAIKAADRVRRKINVLPIEFPDGKSETVTISAGLISVNYNLPANELVEKALNALRAAQSAGTNQIKAPELD